MWVDANIRTKLVQFLLDSYLVVSIFYIQKKLFLDQHLVSLNKLRLETVVHSKYLLDMYRLSWIKKSNKCKTRWSGPFIPKTGYTHSLFFSIMTSQRKWKEPFLSGSPSGPCQNHKISEKIDWHFWKKTFCCYSIIARPLHTTYFLFMKPTAKSILWVSDGWLLCKIVGWVLYE